MHQNLLQQILDVFLINHLSLINLVLLFNLVNHLLVALTGNASHLYQTINCFPSGLHILMNIVWGYRVILVTIVIIIVTIVTIVTIVIIVTIYDYRILRLMIIIITEIFIVLYSMLNPSEIKVILLTNLLLTLIVILSL